MYTKINKYISKGLGFMKKQLLDSKFIIIADEKEHIEIKEIKNCIKSLESLGINNIKIKGLIDIDFENHNNHISENDANKLYKCYTRSEYIDIEIINNKKVLLGNYNKFEIKVNKDNSYDFEGIHNEYFLSPIKNIELSWR
jgi:hypothetical protein